MPAYHLLDPRDTVRDYPYTFFVPSKQEVAEVGPGDLVKLIFAADPPGRTYAAERMWVVVAHRDGDQFSGHLDNDPEDVPSLACGDEVTFEAHHIIAVDWQDKDEKVRFAADAAEQNRFFERCIVDSAVIEGRARVQFLYREPPERLEKEEYSDSGWRIRADVDDLSAEEYETQTPELVALGTVLNQDDSFLRLIDSPVGSAFMRDDKGHYHPARYVGEPLKPTWIKRFIHWFKNRKSGTG